MRVNNWMNAALNTQQLLSCDELRVANSVEIMTFVM